MNKIKTVIIGVLMAFAILIITGFFYARQFEPFIALYVPSLKNIPFDSFSDKMDTTYDVVMTSDNTGFLEKL